MKGQRKDRGRQRKAQGSIKKVGGKEIKPTYHDGTAAMGEERSFNVPIRRTTCRLRRNGPSGTFLQGHQPAKVTRKEGVLGEREGKLPDLVYDFKQNRSAREMSTIVATRKKN